MKKIVVSDGSPLIAYGDEPDCDRANRVLIRVRYSAISPGTELKLLSNPSVPNGFELGYSASGQVMEVGSEVTTLKKGDWVACYGGPYVYHAERLSVPETLCVRLSSENLLRPAAFIGPGAVAIHSLRRLALQFGETVWVIGQGVLGQLIARLALNANYRVFATDQNPGRCELARSIGIDCVYNAGETLPVAAKIEQLTEGHGFDAILLCAHSENPGIVDYALERSAFRGKIAVVGNIPMAFSRELFFQKEADLVIARAAGPGRYDKQYEDEGIDYPKSYVRWTEGRNMREFVRQLEAGLLPLNALITHEYSLAEAHYGYTKLVAEQGTSLGVLIRYD
ncbi:zinc-binding alcohol dehydrogenase [Paenibacillus sp. GCM10027626]|uniref:zinc-dependent alcohol dehydrogenase n=1 Tax=Paenibacillus sp. GCM10027626 TaxID=3273411 RepID=UPI003628C546